MEKSLVKWRYLPTCTLHLVHSLSLWRLLHVAPWHIYRTSLPLPLIEATNDKQLRLFTVLIATWKHPPTFKGYSPNIHDYTNNNIIRMLLEVWFSRQSTTLPVITTYLSHIYHHLCKHKACGGHAFLVYRAWHSSLLCVHMLVIIIHVFS